MHAFVTGGAGFVARHLAAELRTAGWRLTLFDHAWHGPATPGDTCVTGDLREEAAVRAAVAAARPDACVHLGAVAYVPDAERDPEDALRVNVYGTVNLLTALQAEAPRCRTLVVSTAHVYGPADDVLNEDAPLRPANVYAASKAAAEAAALAWAREEGLDVRVARPNNHTGPGQSPRFVVPALAAQVDAVRKGAPGPIAVGNLDSRRVLLDVRDVARAYRLLLEHGRSGTAYNISSGADVTIREVFERLCRLADVAPAFRVDLDRFRPTDRSPRLDTARIEHDTGWRAEVPLDRTLADVLAAVAQETVPA